MTDEITPSEYLEELRKDYELLLMQHERLVQAALQVVDEGWSDWNEAEIWCIDLDTLHGLQACVSHREE